MERALVTGAAGFLGGRLVAALAAQGVAVVALARRSGEAPPVRGVALAVGDLRDAAACDRALDGVDTVFHLAAQRNVPGTPPAVFRDVNETATLRLARQALASGVVRFVHVSSAQMYGPSPVPLDEAAPLRTEPPAGSYAASRARAVRGLRELVRAGLPAVTVSPTLVYGPDRPAHPNRLTAHVRRLLGRPCDLVIDGGRARRNLVHADDVVATLLAAARAPGVEGQEFLVGGEETTQRELGDLVRRCAGKGAPVRVSLAGGPLRAAARMLDRALRYDAGAGWASAVETLRRDWSFDDSKGRSALGHRPRALARGMAEVVEWLLSEEGRWTLNR